MRRSPLLPRAARAVTRRALLVLAAALPLAGCLGNPAEPERRAGRQILFIGNSLTYYNDLPLVVEAFADSAGGERLAVSMVAAPNASLLDHWNAGAAASAIASQQWSVVVLQQGPSSLDASRAELLDLSERFAGRIRAAGGTPALYQVWSGPGIVSDFDRTLESYALAAEHVDGLLLPAGEAWKAALARDPALPLYDLDGFHPTPAGSYLAALAVYAGITGQSPLGLPPRLRLRTGGELGVPDATAQLLQEVVAAVMAP
jgi:hypothetical protein